VRDNDGTRHEPLAGLAAGGGPVRLDLLDATTLDRIDSTDALPGGYPSYADTVPLTGWGERRARSRSRPTSATIRTASRSWTTGVARWSWGEI
jgi:hypothetical protein